jgi:hypothetical protein
MDEKQRKSFDRSIQRAVARSGNDEDEKLSLFIRVAESQIYNGKPLHKALLKEVIFLRLHDLHDGDLRIPKHTPWSKDFRKYEGWCYASQGYLANRVGCVRETANRRLKQIVKDGYLKTRKWRGKNGSWHKQYFPDEWAIDEKIAELKASADKSDDNSDGTPSDLKSHGQVTLDHVPSDIGSHGQVTLKLNPRDLKSQQVVSCSSPEVGGEARPFRQPPSASPSGIADCVTPSNQEKAKPNPAGALSSQAKTKATPTPKAKAAAAPRRGIVGFDGELVGVGFEEEPAGFDVEEA